MKTPMLLIYNLQGDRGQRVRRLAARYKVRVRAVRPEELERPIGELAAEDAATGHAPCQGPGFAEEMMVLAHFPGALIHRFLDSFRQAGLSSVKLKALMTDTNSQWSSLHLYDELKQEAAYFGQLRKMAHDQKQTQPADQPAP